MTSGLGARRCGPWHSQIGVEITRPALLLFEGANECEFCLYSHVREICVRIRTILLAVFCQISLACPRNIKVVLPPTFFHSFVS